MAAAVRGEWLVILAAVLWGTTGTSQALAPESAAPPTIGAARLAIGGLALLLLASRKYRFSQSAAPIVHKKALLLPISLAAVCIAAYQLTFFAGVARTGVAVGTVVAIGSAPIFTGAYGQFFQHERLERRWWLATLLAVFGCGLLFLPSRSAVIDFSGVFLALGAGLVYAAFTVTNKILFADLTPDFTVAAVFSLAALLLLPVWLAGDMRWLLEPGGLLVALHLGLLATAAAYVFFARGLSRIPAATAVTLSLAEPLTAAVLGLTLLGERLTLPMAGGLLLILAGLALLTVKSL